LNKKTQYHTNLMLTTIMVLQIMIMSQMVECSTRITISNHNMIIDTISRLVHNQLMDNKIIIIENTLCLVRVIVSKIKVECIIEIIQVKLLRVEWAIILICWMIMNYQCWHMIRMKMKGRAILMIMNSIKV